MTSYTSIYSSFLDIDMGFDASASASTTEETDQRFVRGSHPTVTASELLDALNFDILFINTYGTNDEIIQESMNYCASPLREYFQGAYFPSFEPHDNTTERIDYLNLASNFYSITVYNFLGCTF